MDNANPDRESAAEKSHPVEPSPHFRQHGPHQNAAYVDAMLNFAPGPQGKPYIARKQAHLQSGLNSFLREAIPMGGLQNNPTAGIELPADSPLWRHIDMLDGYLQVFGFDFIQNPVRSVFFDVMARQEFRRGSWSIFNRNAIATHNDWKKRNHAFVKLIEEMRQESFLINIEKKMHAWGYPTASNSRRVDEYIDYLFKRCHEVFVVEMIALHPQSSITNSIDVMERRAALEQQQMMDFQLALADSKTLDKEINPSTAIPALPRETLGRDLRRVFDNLGNKRSISRAKVGHASSIEWSQLIGHYARLLFFFDSNGAVAPDTLAELLRDYFSETTKGEVTFINCNKAPSLYPETGLISATDFTRRGLLHRRMQLWGQKENFLRIKASQGLRSFRTGDIPAA